MRYYKSVIMIVCCVCLFGCVQAVNVVEIPGVQQVADGIRIELHDFVERC